MPNMMIMRVNITCHAVKMKHQTTFFLTIFQLLPQQQSRIPETWLPVDALSELPPEETTVGLVSYMQHRQFQVGPVTMYNLL